MISPEDWRAPHVTDDPEDAVRHVVTATGAVAPKRPPSPRRPTLSKQGAASGPFAFLRVDELADPLALLDLAAPGAGLAAPALDEILEALEIALDAPAVDPSALPSCYHARPSRGPSATVTRVSLSPSGSNVTTPLVP